MFRASSLSMKSIGGRPREPWTRRIQINQTKQSRRNHRNNSPDRFLQAALQIVIVDIRDRIPKSLNIPLSFEPPQIDNESPGGNYGNREGYNNKSLCPACLIKYLHLWFNFFLIMKQELYLKTDETDLPFILFKLTMYLWTNSVRLIEKSAQRLVENRSQYLINPQRILKVISKFSRASLFTE